MITRKKKLGLFALWCAGLLTVLGCNLLFPMQQPVPAEEVSVLPPTVMNRLVTATPSATAAVVQTPLATLLQVQVVNKNVAKTATSTATPTAFPSPTPAAIALVTADLVNLRNAPDRNSQILGQATTGERLQVVAISNDGQWVQVCCPRTIESPGSATWINKEFVELTTAAPDAATAQTVNAAANGFGGVINNDLVNLRGGPGANYAIVGQARKGDQNAIVGRNEASDWWRICCPLGEQTESWVSAQFVELKLPAGQTAQAIPVVAAPEPPAPAAQGGGNQAAALQAAPASGLPGAGAFGAVGGTNPLTGLGGGRPGQRPIIVCINNDYAARPQFGMSQADVVYEYLMEGYGITRFSAIYYGEESAQIGPVRSARLINYYMGSLYDAGLACSGASDQVRFSLKHEAPFPYMDVDLDDPSNNRYSVSIGNDYRTRLRTSTGGLRRWLADWGVEKAPNLRGFTFGGAGGGAPASIVTIPYPAGTGSQVQYRYDGGSGRYLRFMGGGAHVDGNSGAQIAVENAIVQYVPHEATNIVEDSLGSTSIRLNLFGSGKAILFRDGQAFVGSWRSDSRGDLPHFFDQNGAEVALKPGKSWISVVPLDYAVNYQ